ncbi:hypothetical protein P7C71_g4962, partial [Lecanoromycetidae sp. Uapishka_2]
MGRHSTAIVTSVITPPSSTSPTRKRKRDEVSKAEIEVDISAPEPPSKKALRKAKKSKTAQEVPERSTQTVHASRANLIATNLDSDPEEKLLDPTNTKRSEYGIWIGNLPWTATKPDLRSFLTKDTGITDDMISRLHMPAPSKVESAKSRQRIKPQNKGFAYVDFSTKEALAEALSLSEKLLTGRRVLIKDSKSFEGRPEGTKEDAVAATRSGKPPSNRIFVGNLAFDVTKDALQDHFERCGEVADAFITTFEDTGKCKGYGWVTFASITSAEAAVRGWVDYEELKENAEDEEDDIAEALADQEDVKPKKKPEPRKWWVNRLGGRPLKIEFAEGKDVRYKKRYGKDGTAKKEDKEVAQGPDIDSSAQLKERKYDKRPPSNSEGQNGKRLPRKIDARTIKPGAALAAAPRLTGGIVPSQGKKTTFE